MVGSTGRLLPLVLLLQHIPRLVTGQLLVSVHPCGLTSTISAGAPPPTSEAAIDATGVQLQGVLDSLFTYDGPLGYHRGSPPLKGGAAAGGKGGAVTVWAPTAQKVSEHSAPRSSQWL